MAGKKRPDFTVNSVVGDGEHTRWREIGAAFWNDGQETMTILLDALPTNGKLVLTQPKAARSVDAEA